MRLRRGRPSRSGHVALVGAGPGDPELITVRGRRLLDCADVVVVDRLAPRALVDGLPPHVEVVHVGKRRGLHLRSQDAIEALLVERARRGLRVVRLKGGDPFVLGRGGEEVLACRAAGVDVEVVPGVSSAFGVPAAAGIPVTHRGVSTAVTVVAAHDDPEALGCSVDWEAHARTGATLVLLMGVAHLGAVCRALLRGGRIASTPVAVVHAGTTADEQVLVTELGFLARGEHAAALSSPSVVVVGEVVRLRARLLAEAAGLPAPPPHSHRVLAESTV